MRRFVLLFVVMLSWSAGAQAQRAQGAPGKNARRAAGPRVAKPKIPSHHELDRMREQGDPLADATVAEFFRSFGRHGNTEGGPFKELARQLKPGAENRSPAIQRYLEEAGALPAWADSERVRAGQEVFERRSLPIMSALYMASLPEAYSAAKGAQVLRMTARLQNDTQRRLNETAQFVLNTMDHGALEAGGSGIDSILHVRLMHAAVRWYIENSPHIVRMPKAKKNQAVRGLFDAADNQWFPEWGKPINQEDMLGTLLTFTQSVFRAFERSGISMKEQEVNDYLHTWSVIGHVLGVRSDLLPLVSGEQAAILGQTIERRQAAPSKAGQDLTKALLEAGRNNLPAGLRKLGLAETGIREMAGDDVANLLGVPPATRMRHVWSLGRRLNRKFDSTFAASASRRVTGWAGERLLSSFLHFQRKGKRVEFTIPDGIRPSKPKSTNP